MEATGNISYGDLYARWERGNWSATDVDLSVDRRQWQEELRPERRRAILWSCSLFLHGERVVADTLGPFIDAAPLSEQKHFLATQQADEARHTVFFARFMQEVVGTADEALDATFAATRNELTWGFKRLFGRLERLATELRNDPTLERLAEGVTLYHLLIEASLAQPGQRMLEEHLARTQMLPGLACGLERIAADEQRHIGFGVKLIADLVTERPSCQQAIERMLREALPWVVSVSVPPMWDETYFTDLGTTLLDQYEEAQRSFEARLRAAGVSPDALHGAVPWSYAMTPRKRAERTLLLLRANMLGEKKGAPARDAEAIGVLFDTMRLAIDHRHAPARPVAVQWDFTDLTPWHLHIENGTSRVESGSTANPHLTLRCCFEDWVEIFARRLDVRRAMLTGRLRARGSIPVLLRMQRMFG